MGDTPSAHVHEPVPKLVTTPPLMRRRRQLFLSPAYTVPLLSTARPVGKLNNADRAAPSPKQQAPEPAKLLTVQAIGEPVGVGEGVGRGEGVALPVAEGSTVGGGLGVALGEAPGLSEGEALKDAVGEAEGADTNCTLATKPASCVLLSVKKATVSELPVLVQEPSADPE